MPNPTAILGALVGAIILAVASFFYGGHVEALKWEAAIAEQKAEAGKQLAAETQKVLAAERAHALLTQRLEKDHVEHQAALDRAYADARRAVAAAGGLRDPGRRPGGGCPMPAAAGPAGSPADAAPAGGLSAEAEEFLWAFARDADRAAEYAATCHRFLTGGGP